MVINVWNMQHVMYVMCNKNFILGLSMQDYFLKHKEIFYSKQCYLKPVITVSNKSPLSDFYRMALAYTQSSRYQASREKRCQEVNTHKQFFQFVEHLAQSFCREIQPFMTFYKFTLR